MNGIKKIIALVLVLQWVVSTSAILTLLILGAIDKNDGIDLLKNYSSITSGFVGIVIGYLFSSKDD